MLAGNPTTFICVASASKPQACIRAYRRSSGNVREIDPGECTQDANSIQTTNRTLTFTAIAEENGAELYCNASNSVTDPPVRSQVYRLNVLYPPQSGVRLSGYVNNTTVESGKTLTLTSQVGEGNPRPALTWSSGCGQTNPVPGNDGSQQISTSITVSPSLNQKTCVCKGSQDGALTRWTEQKSRTFNVTFGPDIVQLRADSGQSENTVTVAEHSTLTFTCNTSESNPAAVLSWYNNSSPTAGAEISEVSSQRGPNYGYLTTQRYTVRVDRYQDGDVIRCEAHRPVNGGLIIEVMYAPGITCNSTHVILFEGQRVEISCDVTSKASKVSIHWYKSGRRTDNAVTTNSRGPARRDVTMSTLTFESAETRLSGVYQIEATNSIGSSTRDITISVIEGQFIPKELRLISCTDNQASLVWASGIEDSLVTCYKLEYKGTGEGWEGVPVRNPGRIKLVETTVYNLQPGVFYRFRLQPNSGVALSHYAMTNCTVEESRRSQRQTDVPEAGLNKGGMLAIGVVIGIAIVTIVVVSAFCWRRRKTPLRRNKEPSLDQENADQVMRAVEDIDGRSENMVVESSAGLEPSAPGNYEDLDTRPISAGPHYEELAGRASSSTSRESRVYENATVF